MKSIVIDNNVLFSLMSPSSISSYLFSSINLKFIAPEFIKEELEEHKGECLLKSKLSEEEFNIRKEEIFQSITFFPVSEYKQHLKAALSLISDPDDIDFLALALSKNADIWSNDSHLSEQSTVKVFTTQDLLAFFLKGDI